MTALDPAFARALARAGRTPAPAGSIAVNAKGRPVKAKRSSADQRARVRGGASAEAIVEAQNAACRMMKVADVYKIPTPTEGANGARRFSKRSTMDYGGWLRGGRGLAIEVKSCPGGAFYLAGVEPHQREWLDRAHGAGALALLVFVHGKPLHAVYPVPWASVRGAIRVDMADASAWRARDGETYLHRFVKGTT